MYRKLTALLVATLLMLPMVAFAMGDSPGADESADAKVVKVFGAFRDEEARRFEEVIKIYEDEAGVDVVYEGSAEFETQIIVLSEGGTPPDVTALPQPGLMKNFADRGSLTPLWSEILAKIDKNYSSSWKDLGSHNGKVYGVFHRVNAKSFVWYNKPAFEAKGYEIPKTWDELIDLQNKIVADGGVPWSIGIESGGATGWAATDWMEDIMLRTAGPEVYDKWVNHEIPFNDPAVKKAAETMAEIWLDDRYALGGPTNILTTNFGDAVKPLFEDPPQAWLHRQGNFITGFMQDEVQADLDNMVGVFALPQINPKWGTPVLGGGDQFVVFDGKDRDAVRGFMEFLTEGRSGTPWARSGGALFPHQDQDLSAYATEIERKLAEILVGAEVFRFDASDLMPGEVGAGTFWTGMADLVSGVGIDDVLSEIEKSWP
jgi:alpha-glucoside transport system substrate-binding protein